MLRWMQDTPTGHPPAPAITSEASPQAQASICSAPPEGRNPLRSRDKLGPPRASASREQLGQGWAICGGGASFTGPRAADQEGLSKSPEAGGLLSLRGKAHPSRHL